MTRRFHLRIRIRTALAVVALLAVALAYVASYEHAKWRGKREAAEYGFPGLLYVSCRDMPDIRSWAQQDAWAFFYEPLNLVDRKLFRGPSHWAHYYTMWRLSG
ncbi:hypothetical protein [Aquisphaera insulae]|uniref:hypothetical protein n=1 Tax=Aquisphaera insulae TaxID=2712864 RepID=UPI0013ECB3C4|nr:hypothetical protein [Aquisphaera insulae]